MVVIVSTVENVSVVRDNEDEDEDDDEDEDGLLDFRLSAFRGRHNEVSIMRGGRGFHISPLLLFSHVVTITVTSSPKPKPKVSWFTFKQVHCFS